MEIMMKMLEQSIMTGDSPSAGVSSHGLKGDIFETMLQGMMKEGTGKGLGEELTNLLNNQGKFFDSEADETEKEMDGIITSFAGIGEALYPLPEVTREDGVQNKGNLPSEEEIRNQLLLFLEQYGLNHDQVDGKSGDFVSESVNSHMINGIPDNVIYHGETETQGEPGKQESVQELSSAEIAESESESSEKTLLELLSQLLDMYGSRSVDKVEGFEIMEEVDNSLELEEKTSGQNLTLHDPGDNQFSEEPVESAADMLPFSITHEGSNLLADFPVEVVEIVQKIVAFLEQNPEFKDLTSEEFMESMAGQNSDLAGIIQEVAGNLHLEDTPLDEAVMRIIAHIMSANGETVASVSNSEGKAEMQGLARPFMAESPVTGNSLAGEEQTPSSLKEHANADRDGSDDGRSTKGEGGFALKENRSGSPKADGEKSSFLDITRMVVPETSEKVQSNNSATQVKQADVPFRGAVLDQISARLSYFRENGSIPGEMRMTLNPPHLGELVIRVLSQDGKLTAEIITGAEKVKGMLESGLGELRNRFQQMNINLDRIDVFVANDNDEKGSRFSREDGPSGANRGGKNGQGKNEGDDEAEKQVTMNVSGNGTLELWA